ncbi:MAG: hypothetical protein M9944_08125 [Rhizobiaceae bacterium]|nr:hypothetical protein [Rhizobiaceae bacterium]
MFGLFDGLKASAALAVLGAGSLVGFLAGAGLFYQIGHWQGEDAGREAERGAARERALELIKQRSEDNAAISRLDMAGLCVELGGVWVPETAECR